MAIITFWSDWKGEKGKTVSIAAIATQLSLEYNYKILIVNTKRGDKTMEDCFWDSTGSTKKHNFQEAGKTDIDTGIKGLSKAILSGRTAPEIVANYTRTIFKGKLELLTDSVSTDEEYQGQRELFKDMIKLADKYYDLVFVDLEGDINDPVVSGILSTSVIIVPTLTQSLRTINAYIELKENQELLNGENIMTLLGRYDKYSKYNFKNVARHLRVKHAHGIPYNTLFFEACNEGKVVDYFIKFKKALPTETNGSVTNAVRGFSADLLGMLRMMQVNV